MNDPRPVGLRRSLIERAAERFDLRNALGLDAAPAMPVVAPARPAPAMAPVDPAPAVAAPAWPGRPVTHARVAVDRLALTNRRLLAPGGPVTAQSEQFRLVKRQLLLSARGGKGVEQVAQGERILIASAEPGDGKTWVTLNLALSMAAEKDDNVLLIDADFANPRIGATFGIQDRPGLMDALADPTLDPEALVVDTDIPGLSILPSGRSTGADTEYIASQRTEELLSRLTGADAARIMLIDSPPLLSLSAASVLALHVGQVVMVVRADHTTETALADALRLLGGCANVRLLLNRGTMRLRAADYGAYYGKEGHR